MKGMREWTHNWKRRNWRTAAKKPVQRRALAAPGRAVIRRDVERVWVRISGDPGNELADALANRGVDDFTRNGVTGENEERQ